MIKEERENNASIPSYHPTPQFFLFENNGFNSDVAEKMNHTLFTSCLRHIANKVENNTQYIIKGQKTIIISNDVDKVMNANEIFDVTEDIYKIKRFIKDKLQIVRNVFSVYLSNEVSLKDVDSELLSISETINNHFHAYLDDQVNSFLENTKDAVEEVRKYAKEASEAAEEITSKINTVMLSGVTAFLTSVFVVSQRNYLLLFATVILHILYLIIMYLYNSKHSRSRGRDIEQSYIKSSQKTPLVSEKERTEIKNTFLKPSLEKIEESIKVYKKFTMGIVIASLCIIPLFLFLFPPIDKQKEEEQNIKIYLIRAKVERDSVIIIEKDHKENQIFI